MTITQKAKTKVQTMPRLKRARAVAVAKDVIKQLTLRDPKKRLKAGHYGYFAFCYSELPESLRDGRNLKSCDVSEIVDQLQPYCIVCAKGAAVLSRARLYNAVPSTDVESGGTWDALKDVFDERTYDGIEQAYEIWDCDYHEICCKTCYLCLCFEFGKRYTKPADRLKAIMENIVKNKGVFKP